MHLIHLPPPDITPQRPDAGTAAPPAPRLPLAPVANSPADAALSAAAAAADLVHIHPLDLTGAMQIMIAEVRAELPHGGGPHLEPLLLATGALPEESVAATAPQTLVQLFLQALPPPETLEPQVWLAAAMEIEGKMQVALDRAVEATVAWRDVPAAVVDGARDTRAVVVTAITDDLPNPLWLRPEWLGLAPRMERYWRRRRRARRWLRDPDLHWRQRDEDRERTDKEGG